MNLVNIYLKFTYASDHASDSGGAKRLLEGLKVGLLGNKEPLDLDLKDKLDCRMREVFHAEEIEVTMV